MNLPDFETHDNLIHGLDPAKKASHLAILSSSGKGLSNLLSIDDDSFLEPAKHLLPADAIAPDVSTSANVGGRCSIRRESIRTVFKALRIC